MKRPPPFGPGSLESAETSERSVQPERRSSAGPSRPFGTLIVGARGLRGGLDRLHDRLLQVVDGGPPDGVGRAIRRVGVIPRGSDRGRGEGCVTAGGAEIALRAAGDGQGGEGERNESSMNRSLGSEPIMRAVGAKTARVFREDRGPPQPYRAALHSLRCRGSREIVRRAGSRPRRS